MRRNIHSTLVMLLVAGFSLELLGQGTTFTYQGRLQDGGLPANGLYDLSFSLFDTANGGAQLASSLVFNGVAVSNGLFAVTLDFGANFPGADRWLQINVRTNGAASFTALMVRQRLTPAPYAIYAAAAGPGGTGNAITAPGATVGGGQNNTASGGYATVPGGSDNTAAGLYSFAAGNRAKANHDGAFVWADSQAADFGSLRSDEFAIRAQNGVRLLSDVGIHLNAKDRPIIVRDWDPFAATATGGKAGIGRWGLFMEPSRLTLGIPSDVDVPGRIFQVAKYSTNGTYTALLRVDQNGQLGLGAGISSFGASLDIQEPQASLRLHSAGVSPLGSEITLESFADIIHPTIGGIHWTNMNGTSADVSVGLVSAAIGAVTQVQVKSDGQQVASFDPHGLRVGAPLEVSTAGYLLTAGGAAASFNRLNSDGVVIDIARDGASQGNISVSGSTVSYNAFTGSHYAWMEAPIKEGILVRLTGQNRHYHNDPKSEIIYGIEPTVRANDSACLGAYLGLQWPDRAPSTDNPHLVMAAGNGELWVVDSGGDLEPGDALISSEVPGCAMKDDPKRFAVGHVVARAAERVSWAEVRPDSRGIRRRKISVLFDSFERSGGDVAELARVIKEQANEIATLKQRLDALQATAKWRPQPPVAGIAASNDRTWR